MTAPRSFREAFTEDPADMKDRARLVAERDSARDWAAALENRIEKALDLCRKAEDEAIEATNDYFGDTPRAIVYAAPIAAALTGGEDDARA